MRQSGLLESKFGDPVSFSGQALFFAGMLLIAASPLLFYALLLPGVHFNDDMFQEYLSCAIFRNGVLTDHAFTLWTPMVGGGYPIYAHPHESSFVAAFWPAVLAFGEVAGVRVNILLIYVVSVFGMFVLCRKLEGPAGQGSTAILVTILYAASPVFVETVVSGNFNELMVWTLPAILVAADRGMRSRPWFLLAAVMISFIAFFGKYSFVYVLFAVSVAGIWRIRVSGQPGQRLSMMVRLALLLLVAAGISAVKLIPMVDLILTSDYNVAGSPFHVLKLKYYLPIIYGILAFVASRLLLLAVGRRRGSPLIAIALAALVLTAFNAYTMRSGLETSPAPSTERSAPFHQIRGEGLAIDGMRTPHSNGYLNFLRGVGTIDWYDDWIGIRSTVVPAITVDTGDRLASNPRYSGEAWLADPGAGRVVSITSRANRIDLEVELRRPATVILNHNFLNGWRSDRPLRNEGGLLGVKIDRPGKSAVSLRYFPDVLVAGIAVSLCALVIGLAAPPVRRRRPES